MMYSAYKLNKQSDNIQPSCSPLMIWIHSAFPHPVITVVSWPSYRFIRRQVMWYGIPISWRIFHSLFCDPQSKALAYSIKQFSSVAQSCPTLYDTIDWSTPGFPVHHQLPRFTQTHVHWVSDTIQPSHPLWFPSLHASNLSQHQGLFHWVRSSHQVAKLLEFQLHHQYFQWIFRTYFL